MENNILIADDNQHLAVKLKTYIKKYNKTVTNIQIATNGVDARKIINENEPEIVILDLKMPECDGTKILKEITNKNIFVIVISGEIDFLNKINILDYKVIKRIYIKPFKFENLNKDVEYLFETRHINFIEDKIEKELNAFKFNKNSKGYKYLVECLKYCYQQPELIENLESFLFSKVSKNNNIKNSKKIKWTIQKTMYSMKRYTDKKIILRYFPNKETFTIKNFITIFNNLIIEKYKIS